MITGSTSIGNLGYANDRVVGKTPVYRLNCINLAIEPVMISGDAPGWISRHQAVLADRQIRISGGQIWKTAQDQLTLIENDAQYILDLSQCVWQRV